MTKINFNNFDEPSLSEEYKTVRFSTYRLIKHMFMSWTGGAGSQRAVEKVLQELLTAALNEWEEREAWSVKLTINCKE